MIKLLIFSFKKSKLLSKIAAHSGQNSFDAGEFLNDTIKSHFQGTTLSKREIYIEQLLTLLASDKGTTTLLAEHRKSFNDVRNIIKKLESAGAGQIVKGQYVAVSSIAFLKQLRIVLQHWDGDNFRIGDLNSHDSSLKMAYHLIESFS